VGAWSLTVRQLLEHLPGGTRQPYTTVLGLLQNMEKAGLVTHQEEGLTYRYVPAVTRQEATGTLLRDFLSRFFGGSAAALVLGLVDSQALSPAELRAIEAKLGQASTDGRTTPNRPAGSKSRPTEPRRRPKP